MSASRISPRVSSSTLKPDGPGAPWSCARPRATLWSMRPGSIRAIASSVPTALATISPMTPCRPNQDTMAKIAISEATLPAWFQNSLRAICRGNSRSPTRPRVRPARAGPITAPTTAVPIWPVQTMALFGMSRITKAATVTSTTGTDMRARFQVELSTRAPQRGVTARPTSPPIVAIQPRVRVDQPLVAKNASRKGPRPSRASARKKLRMASANSERSEVRRGAAAAVTRVAMGSASRKPAISNRMLALMHQR